MVDNAAGALRGRRVAIFTHSHPSLSKGGAEISAQSLFLGLRAIGVDAILIAACEEESFDRLELGPNEFALPYRGEYYDHFYHLAPTGVRRALVDLLRREQIDIFNAHHFLYAGIDSFREVTETGIAVVFTIHEFLAICHNHGQMITRAAQLLCDGPSPSACQNCYPEHTRQQFAVRARHVGDALASVAAFVSPSHFLADRMTANGVPSDRMNIIENGIPQREPMPLVTSLAERRVWTFGFFGQINPFKGLDVILRACSILARDKEISSRVRVAIHGHFVGQSDEFIARFHAAVEEYAFLSYLGPYDNRNVGRLMAACDYVVAPSTWWENSPVVIQEAYHARRPVICTGIGGMAEKVVDRVTGLHFARNDAGDLVEKIIAAADAGLYRQLQEALPAAHTPIDMAEQYAALFGKVLAESSIALVD